MTSCKSNNKREVIHDLYGIEILHRPQRGNMPKNDKYRFKYSPKSLYLMFESGFKNSSLFLQVNGKTKYLDLNLNTMEAVSIASDIVLDNIQEIDNVSFRIDNGPLIFLEINDIKDNIIGINKDTDLVSVLFYKNAPMYD